MSALLSPNPVLRFYGSDGQPLSGGYLQTLDSETSNPVATYRDAGMTTENPSTIMLDANGEPSDNGVPVGVFLVPDAVYKFKWFDRDMSLVGASDGIVAGGGSGSGTGLVEVIGTAEHINVTHSVVRGVSVYRVDLAPSLVSEIDFLEESVVQLGGEMDALEGIVASKADKVSNATAGNLAALDASGNLTDSGKNATDFATDEQGAKADTAVQGVKVNGTELSKDGNNKVDVPVPTASTATPLKDGAASAGSSTQWARGDHRHPTDDSREAVANKVQSINVESETDYPSSKAVADFVNSSVATNTATFLGNFSLADLGLAYPATEVQIASALNSHTWPTGYPTNNDYVYVEVRNPQSTIDDKVQRYKYRDRLASWGYEYTLNNSSFTAEEKAAIDSGVTSQDVTNLRADHTTLGTHVANTSNPHNVTAAQVGLGNVDNTSDADKPISTAQQTALNAKQNNVSTDTDSSAFGDDTTIATGFSSNKLHLNIASRLWTYIQGKISSVLGLTSSSYGGNAAAATTATNYASSGGIADALAGKSSTSHTHSVKINGTTKTIPATGDTAVDLGTYLTSHQDISGKLDKTGNGSNLSVTPDGTSTGYDLGSSATLKAFAQKFKNLVGALKALAFKDKVSDSDISGTVSDSHIASASTWNGKYTKPSGGIPKTDLASAVQTSLGKADSALQSHQDISGKLDKTGNNGSQAGVSTLINKLSAEDSVPNGNDCYVSEIVYGAGSTNSTYHRRPIRCLWSYIKDQISSVLGLTASSYGGKAATAGTADSAAQVSATGAQKAVAVSVNGISHTNGSKSTVINGGQVSTDTLSAETAVNSDGFWAKSSILVYGGNDPGSPTGNYILMSPNGIACYGSASFTGSLVGNASTATAVKDYGDTSKSIEIGYTGTSLTSANFLAAYAVVNGHTYIKDISPSNVTVGRATSDGSGNNIVNTYQKKMMFSICGRSYSPTINSGSTASVGNRPNNQLGIALLYPLSGTSYIEVSFNLSFTYPSAGGDGAYAVILKAGNSSSSMNQIGSVIKSTYQSGSSNYAEHVTVGGLVSSSPSYLLLEITNGYGSRVTFNLSTILISITRNITEAAQAT